MRKLFVFFCGAFLVFSVIFGIRVGKALTTDVVGLIICTFCMGVCFGLAVGIDPDKLLEMVTVLEEEVEKLETKKEERNTSTQ